MDRKPQIQLTNLVRTGVVVRTTPDHEQFANTAGDCWRAHSFFKGSHLCPAIRKRVIALNAAQAILPIIPSNDIDLGRVVKTIIISLLD